LVAAGFESNFAVVCAEAPTAITLPAVDAIRREASDAVSPTGPKQSRRATSPRAEATGLEPMLTFAELQRESQ
jgi:hypothetical protein